jgi:hypothetical protein
MTSMEVFLREKLQEADARARQLTIRELDLQQRNISIDERMRAPPSKPFMLIDLVYQPPRSGISSRAFPLEAVSYWSYQRPGFNLFFLLTALDQYHEDVNT